MGRIIKSIIIGLLFTAFFGTAARSQTINAASCNSSDVQSAINTATEGETVAIPAGTCNWTSGVSIKGKGITLQGAGAGRVIAVDVESSAISLATGSKTFSNVTNDQGATAYLTAASPGISTGQTLRIVENGFLGNYLQGTVSSFSGSTLVMNVTSAGGSCGAAANNAMNSNCKRWLVTTLPSTVLEDNVASGQMVGITEDSSFHTTIAGIKFAQGSGGGGAGSAIYLARNNSGGQAVLIHDNYFESNNSDIIDGNTNRGVIWNNSFVFSPFSAGQWAAIRIKDANGLAMPYSWTTTSLMGVLDTTGQGNLYFETNDVHADGDFTDNDDEGRMVVRYNVLDNAGGATHGADTSDFGMRYMEYYNNVGLFEPYGDGSTANMNWWMFVRGGTLVAFNNVLAPLTSEDWGSKADFNLTVMNLQRNSGPNPCWGAGSTSGGYYHAPRQVGMGYVTGAGASNYPAASCSNCTKDGYTYVGDSEPVYFWNNTRTKGGAVTPLNVGVADYGTGNSNSCTGTVDSSSHYIVSNRDFFNGGSSPAKPNYSPFTYPHPLASGQQTSNLTPPTNVKAVGH